MGLQFCNASGYAVVVVPKLHGPTEIKLHQWRHIEGAWEPTEHEVLYEETCIEASPTVDEADTPEYVQKRDSWVSAKLAPVLHAVSIRVPRKTTVSICLTQTAEVLTDYPTDVLDRYCAAYGHDQRGVSFVRAHLPGPLKNVPTGAGEYIAVYTINPGNTLRIYDHSGSVPKLVHTGPIREALDTTKPDVPDDGPDWVEVLQKRFADPLDDGAPRDIEPPVVETVGVLEQRVNDWVDTHLARAFGFQAAPDSPPVCHMRLFLPTTDLGANPNNTYNLVHQQIVRRLQKNPHLPDVPVELVGTTESEPLLPLLDGVFGGGEPCLVNHDQYLVSIEHTADTAIVYVDRRNDTFVEEKYRVEVALTQTYDDALQAALKGALAEIRDSENDTTPFITTVVGLDATARFNSWFRAPVQLCMGMRFQLQWWEERYGSLGTNHREREEAVQVPQFRHAVVIDAGSRGTRAFVYRWRINGPVEAEVADPVEGAIVHPRLPCVKLLHSCGVSPGIHTKESDNVEDYLTQLFTNLNQLLAAGIRATTPVFALATGGMRSRRQLAIGHVGRQTTYDALAARIRTEIEAKAVGANSFQSATFDIAEGEEEAVYGWISANYAMGRLEHPAANAGQELAQAQRTKGFLEMGGASLQVAYEVPTDYTRRYMRFSIDHAGFQRDFMVYTREIDNLGAEEARKRYVVGRVPAPGVDLTIDRCWPLGDHPADLLLAGGGVGPVGTGLRPSEAGRPRVFVGELAHSLRPVRQLLPRPFLKAHHPDLDRTMEFVGGACFWHVSQGIYLPNSNRNDKFDRDDIINLILDFASTPWAIHEATIQTAANAKIAGMNDNVVNEKQPGNASIEAKRATLTANEVNFNSGHKRRVLFNAMLTFVTLYIGVRLRIAASFQPYDGVKERTTSNTLKRVSYSWTLGRALLSAIASDVPVAAGLAD